MRTGKWLRWNQVYMGKVQGYGLRIDVLWLSVILRLRSRKEIQRCGRKRTEA